MPLDEEKCNRRAKSNFMSYMEFRRIRVHELSGIHEIKRGGGNRRSVGWIAAPSCGRSIAQHGEGERRVKYNRVRDQMAAPDLLLTRLAESSLLAAKPPALRCIALPGR
jgi:hypothetical protein